MPKGIPCLTKIQKQEIIKRVSDKGECIVHLAKEFKVDPKIIYNLLKTKANQHQAILELAKLKRENEALISIIGSLVAESRIGNKKKEARGYFGLFFIFKKGKSQQICCLQPRLQFLAILFIINQNFQ